MRSRTLGIAALLVAVAAACPPVDAQQAPKTARIGYIAPATAATSAQNIEALRQGLRELGHVEGKTFVPEIRYAKTIGLTIPQSLLRRADQVIQ